MKTLNTFFAIFLGILLITVTKIGTSNEKGAPAGRAGDPPNEITCATSGCHNDFDLNSGNGSLKITVMQDGEEVTTYKPNSTYTIKLELEDPNMNSAGFQITAQRTDNNDATGSFELANQTKFAGSGNDYLTHSDTFKDISNQTKTWNLTWEAPDQGVGEIKFYAAGNAANGQDNSSGDYIYSAEQGLDFGASSVTKENAIKNKLKVYPNPVSETINIQFPKAQQNNYRVTIQDIKGQVIDHFPETLVKNPSVSINIPDGIEEGFYLLRLKSQEEVIKKRILIQ